MSERPQRWLRLLVPIAGLSVVPLVGLVYAATTTFGPSTEKPESSATPFNGADAGTTKPRTRTAKPGAARTAGAKLCCEKLHELAQTSEVDKRATFLAAGAACEAADSDVEAFKQVNSICGGERVDIPPECKSP